MENETLLKENVIDLSTEKLVLTNEEFECIMKNLENFIPPSINKNRRITKEQHVALKKKSLEKSSLLNDFEHSLYTINL